MVVDGQRQFTGSNTGEASKAVTEAVKIPKAIIQIAISGDELGIKISDLPEHDISTVFLAIAEDNLTTKVERGENVGKSLEHRSVVRELKSFGIINPAEKSFESKLILPTNAVWKTENLKMIVFVQENKSRKIIGIKRIAFESK